MTYQPITPFRRAMNAGLMKHQQYATADLPPEGVNKWEALRELTAARKPLGLTDRSLAVLQTLLSFHPDTILGGNTRDLVVYPSNAAICERLNGIACSTMRRHLAGLVNCGIILRRDSPNGKRFVKRYGDDPQAFGFDLTPLVARFAEFCALAEDVRADEDRYARLRRTVSLMRRDLAGLATYGLEARPDTAVWASLVDIAAETSRALRRQLSLDALATLKQSLLAALDIARDVLDAGKTINTITSDVQNEQHHQNSNEDTYVSEPSLEQGTDEGIENDLNPPGEKLPNVPLGLVTSVCLEMQTYAPDPIRHWHQLVHAADVIRPMMGISPTAWGDAVNAMGAEEASVVLVAMLERFNEIKSPGGYLRHLTRKAEQGAFSCGPMVMALMRREAA